MLKQTLKRSAQYIAANYGPHTRKHSRPQLLIIMYHRILPENDERNLYEEPGMTVTPQTFTQNLELLSQYFDFITLADWIKYKQNRQPLPDLACAITFDDGWRDNYEFGYPILVKAQIPATIFVVSSMINSQKQFWPERLARIIQAITKQCPDRWDDSELVWLRKNGGEFSYSKTTPTREQLSHIISHVKQFPDQEIHQQLDQIEKCLNLHIQTDQPPLLSWENLKEMTGSGLIDVGSHTCNHIRLNNMTSHDIIQHEIVSSKNEIEENTGLRVRTFCFPNGDYSTDALKLVKQNYDGAVTTNLGWNSCDSDNYLLSRIGVHEDIAKDKTAFLARISGWLR